MRLSQRSADFKELHLHLNAELDDSVGGEAEKDGGALGVAGHDGEELLAPDHHAVLRTGNDGLAAEKEGGFHGAVFDSTFAAKFQQLGNVGLFHEPVMTDHAMKAIG